MAIAGMSALCGQPLPACEFGSPGSVTQEEELLLRVLRNEQSRRMEKAPEAESVGGQGQACHPRGLS